MKCKILIKNIIFDLGNVLVRVDFRRTRKFILSEGVSKSLFDNFFNEVNKQKYESGRISTALFLNSAYRSLNHKIPKRSLKVIFEDMFFEMKGMRSFLKKISASGRYRTFLLSNTNPLHFNYIKKKFYYINLINKFILSYRLKMLKPDKRIFKTVLKKYKLNPAETLFIDDLKENCLAAEEFDINTIRFINYNDFINKFNKLV